jgi:phospholipase A1/A2
MASKKRRNDMKPFRRGCLTPRGKTAIPSWISAVLVVSVGWWALCGNITAAHAAAVESILAAPSYAVPPHQSVWVTVIFKNPGNALVRFPLENGIRFELTGKDQPITLPAVWEGGPDQHALSLAPGAYSEQRFSLPIPAMAPGYARLKMLAPPSNSVILEIAASPADVSGEEKAGPPSLEGEATLAAMESKIQPYFANLFFYDPIYFLVGADPGKSKFQLSFKYRLFREDAPLAKKSPFFKGLHIAYTQTSFWNLTSDSAPFEDTSYKPEFFYISPGFNLNLPRLYTANLQIGAQHESNGRDGVDSRSTNTLYIKPVFMFAGKSEDAGIMVAPKIMAYVGNDAHTNPDLPDYRGHVDLEIKAGFLESFVLDTHLRYGEKGGSAQFDLTYPLTALLGSNVDLYFYTQYYTGYAESLLHYDRKESALRFGFSIAR